MAGAGNREWGQWLRELGFAVCFRGHPVEERGRPSHRGPGPNPGTVPASQSEGAWAIAFHSLGTSSSDKTRALVWASLAIGSSANLLSPLPGHFQDRQTDSSEHRPPPPAPTAKEPFTSNHLEKLDRDVGDEVLEVYQVFKITPP